MTRTALSALDAYDEKKEQWRVVIETPQGSHNKYKYDPELGIFILNRVLPEGMIFPYDFGFLPGTQGDDGDPVDVLLMTDKPAFCGCVVPSRLLGVIDAEQTEKDGQSERNDRIVAVPVHCRVMSDCHSLKDLNENRLKQITDFFIFYNREDGKKFKVIALHGPKKAEEAAREGMKRSKR